MNASPLTWGLGSFQTCTMTPFIDNSLPADDICPSFSNGKLLTFGFRISPSTDLIRNCEFYDSFNKNLKHLILTYQLVHERKGILLSKSVESEGIKYDGSDNLKTYRDGDDLVITASSRFKVSPMHLHKSLTLSLTLEFSSSKLASIKSHSSQVDEDEKDIKNAIENPKYKPQRVTPRKVKVSLSFIEPLEISVKSEESGSETTLIHITISNKHPKNDLQLLSVNLSMNSTVRDFDGDSLKIGKKDLKEKNSQLLPIFEDYVTDSKYSQKASENNIYEEEHSVTSTDEGNVEEYLKIIRGDRYFHVTEIMPTNDGLNSGNKNTDINENNVFMRIKPGCSLSSTYKVTVKDTSNLLIGNFLTPLGIRYFDLCKNINNPQRTNIISNKIDENLDLNAELSSASSQLSSSSQVAWSVGTQYLNRQAFSKDVHVYNLDSSHSTFHSDGFQHKLSSSKQEYDILDRDYSDQILIAIDGPTICQINELFQVTVRITNLSRKSKRFSLGIQEDKELRILQDSPSFIAIESVTQLSELRCGDSTECIVNILPLQIGMLILDGFHLNESNEESSAYNWDPHPHPLRDDNAPKVTRLFASSFPVNIV